MKCDVFHFLKVCLKVNHAQQVDSAGDLIAVFQKEIASVFVGRFKCGLRRFFGEEKQFPVDRTDLKIVARWRYN